MEQGNGYLGSKRIETSVADQEIIPSPPANWTSGYKLYKLSFMNHNATNVLINGVFELFLDAYQGFEMNEIDEPITSFIIKNSGVKYQWVGAY